MFKCIRITYSVVYAGRRILGERNSAAAPGPKSLIFQIATSSSTVFGSRKILTRIYSRIAFLLIVRSFSPRYGGKLEKAKKGRLSRLIVKSTLRYTYSISGIALAHDMCIKNTVQILYPNSYIKRSICTEVFDVSRQLALALTSSFLDPKNLRYVFFLGYMVLDDINRVQTRYAFCSRFKFLFFFFKQDRYIQKITRVLVLCSLRLSRISL